jgi:hypothetical protein
VKVRVTVQQMGNGLRRSHETTVFREIDLTPKVSISPDLCGRVRSLWNLVEVQALGDVARVTDGDYFCEQRQKTEKRTAGFQTVEADLLVRAETNEVTGRVVTCDSRQAGLYYSSQIREARMRRS